MPQREPTEPELNSVIAAMRRLLPGLAPESLTGETLTHTAHCYVNPRELIEWIKTLEAVKEKL